MNKPNIPLESQIHLNRFKPREYQLPVADALENKNYKRILFISPRRSGKDIVAWNLMIRAALRRTAVYFYIFPTYNQGRKVIWDSITISGMKFLDFIPPQLIESTNSQEMKVRLKNGSIIQLVGSDNVDSLVGSNPYGLVFSEYALQDPRAYQFLRPILLANDGWALFVSTPRGKNHMWELYNIAKESPDWFCYKIGLDETNHIPLQEIEKERAEGLISEDLIQQEYYCFPAGQQVLTSNGCKGIESIIPDDMVVSHSGRLRKVIDTISRDYKGVLYSISSYGSSEPIICTPNHPIQVYDQSSRSYSWKEAQNITKEDRLVFPKKTFRCLKVINHDLCMLMAWYITEGSCFKNGVQWSIKKEEINVISNYITSLGFRFNIQENENIVNVVVNSVQLVDFFKCSCGLQANNKRIPFHLISGYEEKFFDELMKGDGCHNISNGHEKYSYTTVSKTLAYQVQLLSNSLNLGYAAGISKRDAYKGKIEGRDVNCQESYQVNISFPGLRSGGKLIRAKNCIAAKVTDIDSFDYEGKVYNLKVQYDESYLVGGRAVHNCSFEMGVEGSYYLKYLDKMRVSGQIGIVPWEPAFKVHTSWDIGVRDTTAIIFFQSIGQTVRIIDCYEKSKEGLEHYVKVINSKPYTYGRHFAPHDIAVTEWSSGMTRIEKAKQLGLTFVTASNISIEDGIESVRSSFAKIWIDEVKCKQLIKSLENYRQEYDHKRKVYKGQPLHDWSSNYADSMRYLCLSLPRTRDGLSPEELEKRYQEAMYGQEGQLPAMFRSDQYNR